MTMHIAMIGLGKMGANMTTRLLRGGHHVVASDLNEEAIQKAEAEGATGARTLNEVAAKLAPPRAVWVMVPAGKPTESVIQSLADVLSAGDVIIDGGNSNYKETMRRAAALREKGIHFVDVGTSGGVWGLAEGYSMMVGGAKEAVEIIRPALESIAAYVPDSGEGRWTVVEAIELRCSIPVITIALQRRFRSREAAPFSDKLLAAMRSQFGGHAVKRT